MQLSDFIEFVNPLQGTDSTFTYSCGNTLPLIGYPFAMTSWSLQTSDKSNWFFHPRDRQLQGVRATRQPSPWIGDYGHFVIMPQVGERLIPAESRASCYRNKESVIKPNFLKVFLERYQATMELTATERCGFMRITFPAGSQPKRIILDLFCGDSKIEIVDNQQEGKIAGFTCANSGGVPPGFACYFIIEVDCRFLFEESGFFQKNSVFNGRLFSGKEQISAFVGLLPEEGVPVGIRIGTSFISINQAHLNLSKEIGRRSFDEISHQAARKWNSMLGRIEIDPLNKEDKKNFYSCLYRTFLFPRKWYEYDVQNFPKHYSPYDGNIHSGVLYADNGFWDTHRTVYPLLSIIAPEELTEILQGWLNAYLEGGWFPKWPSPGYRKEMIGTHIDAIIADAVTKGIRDFDLQLAFQGLMKHAMQKAPDGLGRIAIEDYIRLGYVPDNHTSYSVSRTLDYAYGDFCIAQVASVLGRKNDACSLLHRAYNYRNVFDSSVKFMRGRGADGSWAEPFDEFSWGGHYIEGSVWQCGWAVSHDPAGLIKLMGGRKKFVDKLTQMMNLPPRYHVGSYKKEIHEMTEMASVDFGQYAHSNQPVHHVLYLFAAAGRPDKTQYWVRRVLQELYNPEPDGFPGDEDNGEMASWFVLSSMGFYPLCPGVPSYIFGSPLVRKAVVHFKSGKNLTIEAKYNATDYVYVKNKKLNGNQLNKTFITHNDLITGGTLQFDMTNKPVVGSTYSQSELPYSISTDASISKILSEKGENVGMS